MSKVKKFIVTASYELEIEAETEKEAIQKAIARFGEDSHYGDEFNYEVIDK